MAALTRPAKLNLALACLLMFLAGSLYALGVFSRALGHASPSGNLGDVLTSSMAVMSLVSAPAMLVAGVYMDGGVDTESDSFGATKTCRLRILSILGAASFAMFVLAGIGADRDNASLLRIAVDVQGVSLGIYYLITIDLLASWMPERPGLAVGCGQMAFGMGAIVFSSVFNALLKAVGCVNALYVTAALWSIPALLSTLCIEWPPPDSGGGGGGGGASDSSGDELSLKPVKISWKVLPFLPSVWLYMGVAFTIQAEFGLVPYFFKIGHSFNKPMHTLVDAFQIANLLGTAGRLFAGILADSLGCGWGHLFSGAKNLMVILMALQTILFFSLSPLSAAGNFDGFMVVVLLLFIVSGAGACDAAVLARDLFSPANSSIMFGVGAGLTMGIGEAVSAGLLSFVDGMHSSADTIPSSYNVYYFIGGWWSFGGLLCILFVERCEEAFEIPGPNGMTTVLVDSGLVHPPVSAKGSSPPLKIPGTDNANETSYDVTRVSSFSFRTPSYVPIFRLDDDDAPSSPFGNTAEYMRSALTDSV